MRLSIEHPDIVEPASEAFWNECRVDLGRAVASVSEMGRDPVDEFESVRAAVRKGMSAAMKTANRKAAESGPGLDLDRLFDLLIQARNSKDVAALQDAIDIVAVAACKTDDF